MSARHCFVRFRSGTVDTIWLGDARAFLLSVPGAPTLVVDGICPHRGGPLALGRYDAATQSLRCPWHGQARSRRQLCAAALPSIRAGDAWTVAIRQPMRADGASASPDAGPILCFRRDHLEVGNSAAGVVGNPV
ncbi:MAG: Rieske 2Fe-2S domain-containing protein [Rhodospirillaceae bacterium]|nr:Rieske 2Fe-2S domain-containing protein [Rhodospirillaceae bacterium]